MKWGFGRNKFKIKIPNVNEHVGRTFSVDAGAPFAKGAKIEVIAERLDPILTKPTHLLINKKHEISLLDFYGQANGEEISQDLIDQFNEQTFEVLPISMEKAK